MFIWAEESGCYLNTDYIKCLRLVRSEMYDWTIIAIMRDNTERWVDNFYETKELAAVALKNLVDEINGGKKC